MAGTKKVHGLNFNDYTRAPANKKKKSGVSRGKKAKQK